MAELSSAERTVLGVTLLIPILFGVFLVISGCTLPIYHVSGEGEVYSRDHKVDDDKEKSEETKP